MPTEESKPTGRPRLMQERQRINVYLDTDLLRRARKLARQRDMPLSILVRGLVREAVEREKVE